MRLLLRRFRARHLLGGLLLFATLGVAALASLRYATARQAGPMYSQSDGATIIVTTTADSGPGTLRQALADAQDGDTIQFDPALNGQTISLTSGELIIDKNITITGPGLGVLAVSRVSGTFRILHTTPGHTVTIEGLKIRGGSSNEAGGGVLNDQATLTLDHCAVEDNYSGGSGGGGIYNFGASAILTVLNSTVNYNLNNGVYFGSGGDGGGINSDGTVTITNSIVSQNSVTAYPPRPGRGGGIFSAGPLQIINSTISYNTGGYVGGGILSFGSTTITNSTIVGNRSIAVGGGISNGGSLTITNSTLSGNTAVFKQSGFGGGVFNSGPLTIANSTFSGNSADAGGGGIDVASGTLQIANTILKTGTQGVNIYVESGTIISQGYNLSTDNGGGLLTGPGDQINTDPLLGPLQNNGGPTFTHELLPGSSAINAGIPNFTPPPDTDQRGFLRVHNGRIDIGSLEVQPIPTPTPTVTPASGIVLVSRLSDARAYANGGAGIVTPPPEIQTDFLPATLSNNATSYGEPGGASGGCTSNSQIELDNQIGTLQITGHGMAGAKAINPGGNQFNAWAAANLIVINFTLTDRSYPFSLTGQLSASGDPGPQHSNLATAKLTRGGVTIFEVIADHSNVTLSETGILQPDNYTLAVDLDAYSGAPQSFGNSSADFSFALGPAPTPTPTIPPPGPATHFTFVYPPDVLQYVPFTFTVTARDQFGKVALGYAGTVHFTSTDTGSGTQLPNDSTLTNGTGTFDITLTTPDYQTITATDTINSSITGTSNTILVFPVEASPTPTPTPSPTATATASATASPSPATAQLLNISTRVRVETGDNVMIGGFIINGAGSLQVAIRGIGPSLGQLGIPDFLPDPVIELRDSSGALIVTNDNWQDDPAQAAQLTKLGLAPGNQAESALVRTLQPGAYTVTVEGNNGGTGIGLVEVYNVDHSVPVGNIELANISTRGLVATGDNVMIGGFILTGASSENAQVAVRGIGPSLTQFGVPNVLADPTLELRDSNGALLIANDNWQDDPASAAELTAHGLAPSDPLESGIFASLQPGLYTAILAGNNAGTGIGLVEIYNVN